MKIWVDRHRGDTTSRLQAFDKKTGQLDIDETASYRRLRGDLWYPSEVITTYYRCDTRGRRELARRETSVVKNQTLNIAIRESAFAFDPPRGSFADAPAH